jgi:molybdate transport system permease protein
MEWTALGVSLRLAAWTAVLLVPAGILAGRLLARHRFRGKALLEAALALPLVLPPTVLGYYLLVTFGSGTAAGRALAALGAPPLAFTFEGLVLASLIANVPFAVQPIQRAFEAVPTDVVDAAACCGMTRLSTFARIELPLTWPGVLSALTMTFAHTIGEFGVVLMVGGNLPGETRTASIAIYDRMQAFDQAAAGTMAIVLLLLSTTAIAAAYLATDRYVQWRRPAR